jgi:deoxyribodipyrimidine photo-lyase
VPVFCFDPRTFTEMAYKDIRRAGILRAKFMIESVVCLRKKLQEIGSNLYVSTAKPHEFIPNLMQNGQATSIVYQRETSMMDRTIEKEVEKAVTAKNVRAVFMPIWGSTLYHIDDLPFDPLKEFSNVITDFKKKTKRVEVRKVF